jgi:hypothetical protein
MELESVGILELDPQNPYAPLNIYEPICNALEVGSFQLSEYAWIFLALKPYLAIITLYL